MKQYHYRGFQHEEQLIEWLNSHQEINVINIIYLEWDLSYQVFYYTEEDLKKNLDDCDYSLLSLL